MQFILVSAPLLVSFTAVLAICLLGYQKALLTHAVATIAERVSLADVTKAELVEVAEKTFVELGIPTANASVSFGDKTVCVRGSLWNDLGVELEAVSFGIVES